MWVKATVSAHAMLVERASGTVEKLLMVRLAYKDQRWGKWSFPGGFVDQGEAVTDALLREVVEEIGIELLQWERMDVIPMLDQEHPNVSFLYISDCWQGEIQCRSRELLEVAWFDCAAFARMVQQGELAYSVIAEQVAVLGWDIEGATRGC
ncbi:NUDIX hydrolase [Candidatus Magnetaquicoccus inordinatus]|uniref:NUDIX hydrolase n=1 Tax=Candidatus Magnetaquicoccus inordinatus TaxID=2496818 RepID=UPI00102C58D0|nr:NUDIX hydrolase [Candidatus Magnetaquicoccus inordinatus]